MRDQRVQVGAVGGGGQHLPGHGGLCDVGNVAAHADVKEVESWDLAMVWWNSDLGLVAKGWGYGCAGSVSEIV